MIREYDGIKATRDLSDRVLKGCVGAVVMIYQEPTLGYEVEFFDKEGDTLEVLTVYPDDIESLR
ncbi:DUF4926 domain-containing protein [Candidatus Symbiopectobacterium sp. NZEC135]|nr:DUF4926 domain-containing protein [Candidatus Symbiopectobacterium sp. NZEC135]